MKKIIMLIGMVLLMVGVVSAVDIDNCTGLTPDTAYTLTSNIQAKNASDCFTMVDNVSIDCDGYTIQGNNSGLDWAFAFGAGDEDVDIRNCILDDWGTGGVYAVTPDNYFYNITLTASGGTFRLHSGAVNNTIDNLTLATPSYLQIYGTAEDIAVKNINGRISISDDTNGNITITNWELDAPSDVSTIKGTNIQIYNLYRHDDTKRLNIYANDLLIDGAVIRDNSEQIRFYELNQNVTVRNSRIIDNTDGARFFEFMGVRNLTFNNNYVSNNTALWFYDLRGFSVYNNTVTETLRHLNFENSSDGQIYNNDLRNSELETSSHGILLNGFSNNIDIYDNRVSGLHFGILHEWNSYNLNTSRNNVTGSVALYELHNTHDNLAYNNRLAGLGVATDNCIRLTDNVTNSQFIGNILSNCPETVEIENVSRSISLANTYPGGSGVIEFIKELPFDVAINETSTGTLSIITNNTGRVNLAYDGRKDIQVTDNTVIVNTLAEEYDDFYNQSNAETKYNQTAPLTFVMLASDVYRVANYDLPTKLINRLSTQERSVFFLMGFLIVFGAIYTAIVNPQIGIIMIILGATIAVAMVRSIL